MLVSMTGFGSSSYEDSNLSINIELKSFNSRYFELNTKSFDLSGPLEYKIRNYLKKQLFRGSVTLIVKVDSKDSFKFNDHKTASVLKAYDEIEKKWLEGIEKVGITSGASTPDKLVYEIVKKLEPKKVIRFHDIDEEIKFEIPRKVKKLLDE